MRDQTSLCYKAKTLDQGTIVNLSYVVIALIFHISTTVLANPVDTPSEINPPISIHDQVKINGYLKNLVEEYEFNPGGVDLTFYFDKDTKTCTLKNATMMVCNVTYLADRWNGSVEAILKVAQGKIIELSLVAFDGNY